MIPSGLVSCSESTRAGSWETVGMISDKTTLFIVNFGDFSFPSLYCLEFAHVVFLRIEGNQSAPSSSQFSISRKTMIKEVLGRCCFIPLLTYLEPVHPNEQKVHHLPFNL
ncbi:hypothetical protein E2542_SST18360 [Spatholobus suberectus]|nr:hypothetical protein E2542_SST18360 [Spatholobus suberectus]